MGGRGAALSAVGLLWWIYSGSFVDGERGGGQARTGTSGVLGVRPPSCGASAHDPELYSSATAPDCASDFSFRRSQLTSVDPSGLDAFASRRDLPWFLPPLSAPLALHSLSATASDLPVVASLAHFLYEFDRDSI